MSRDPLQGAVQAACVLAPDEKAALAVVLTEASALLDYCSRVGVVLTIEQVPLQPLSMGNYVSRVSVRKARTTA